MAGPSKTWVAKTEMHSATMRAPRPRWEDVYTNYMNIRNSSEKSLGTYTWSYPSETSVHNIATPYNNYEDGATRVCLAIDPERSDTSFDTLFKWLLENWGNPKKERDGQDIFVEKPQRLEDIHKKLDGKYGCCMIIKENRNYVTLWEDDNVLDGIEYVGSGGNIYFWRLEANYNTLEDSLEKRLTKIAPNSNINQVAIEGLDIMTTMSADRKCELSATIYDKDGNGLYRIAGLNVGNNEYVVSNDDRLNKAGVTTRMYKAFIHTHVEGTVTFSGADFGSAHLRKLPIYMKHIKYTTVLMATALIVNPLDFTFSKYLREQGGQLYYTDGQTGIDSCDDLKHSGISRTRCPINGRTDLSQRCGYLKEIVARQFAIRQLLDTSKWRDRTKDVAHCLYGVFQKFGQIVKVVRP